MRRGLLESAFIYPCLLTGACPSGPPDGESAPGKDPRRMDTSNTDGRQERLRRAYAPGRTRSARFLLGPDALGQTARLRTRARFRGWAGAVQGGPGLVRRQGATATLSIAGGEPVPGLDGRRARRGNWGLDRDQPGA